MFRTSTVFSRAPTGHRRKALWSALSFTVLSVLLASGALPVRAADATGARDPLDIARMPHSVIVAYERDETLLPREYALGRVDKTRRDVRVEHEVRASATREWATYEMPPGTQTEEVIGHYLSVLDTDALFTCRGRDCGRSNLWANEIFKRAILYGPDRNQFYFAGEQGESLIALYVIERGNKRVYAHLEVLNPERNVALNLNDEVLSRLAGEGQVVVEGVTPDRQGQFDSAETAQLTGLQEGLRVFEGQTIYVVCHLYGSQSGAVLIERSEGCARSAVTLLKTDAGPELVPFGAGPLLPRPGTGSRVELVLPHRLSH